MLKLALELVSFQMKRYIEEGMPMESNSDVCPVDLEAPFLNSFVDGLELKLSDVEQRKSAAESRLFRLRVEQAALKGPVPEKLAKKLDRQETAITNLENEKYQLRLRISELRLQVTSLAR